MKNKSFSVALLIFILTGITYSGTNNGYRLWLKYDLISDSALLNEYKNQIHGCIVQNSKQKLKNLNFKYQQEVIDKINLKCNHFINCINHNYIIPVGEKF